MTSLILILRNFLPLERLAILQNQVSRLPLNLFKWLKSKLKKSRMWCSTIFHLLNDCDENDCEKMNYELFIYKFVEIYNH